MRLRSVGSTGLVLPASSLAARPRLQGTVVAGRAAAVLAVQERESGGALPVRREALPRRLRASG